MSVGLDAAIAGLYRVFQAPPPREIDACPCCNEPGEYRPLHQKPLRSLTSDELGSYASSALLTVGALPDLKYFLPRIFELATLEPHAYPDLEIRLSKLKHGGWRTWPVAEQTAVERFLTEWIEGLSVQSPPDGQVIDAVICGMGCGGCDIGPALARVAQSLDAYVAVYEDNAGFLAKKRRPANAFWQGVDPKVVSQYTEWLEAIGG